MKNLITLIITILFFHSSFCQTGNVETKVKEDKIKFKSAIVVQDSAIATHPIICSVTENENLPQLELQESYAKYNINFYPQPEKGVIYVQLDGLSKDPRTELFLSNEKGEVIYKIRAKTRLNQLNLTKVPPGTYLFTADVDEEISTWEIVKE
jgi:hypothetical protein